MPDSTFVKALPAKLPDDLRQFIACKTTAVDFKHGFQTWVEIPGSPVQFEPEVSFEKGRRGKVNLSVKALGMSASVPISVVGGDLKADLSGLPTDHVLFGDMVKSLAKDIQTALDQLNKEFRDNKMQLGPLDVRNGDLHLDKVPRTAQAALAIPAPSGSTDTEMAALTPRYQDPTVNLNAPSWVRPVAATGVLFGTALVAVGVLNPFGGTGDGPPVVIGAYGSPIVLAGTLDPSPMTNFEIGDVTESEYTLTFANNGGPLTGDGAITFIETAGDNDLILTSNLTDVQGLYDLNAGTLTGVARHELTAEQLGQTQSQEIFPMFLDADIGSNREFIFFENVEWSYDLTISGTVEEAAGAPNPVWVGIWDPAVLSRTDATETVEENGFGFFITEGNQLDGFGTLRVTYAFDSDQFGPDCTFEAIRTVRVTGTYDEAFSYAGTGSVLAWGNVGETCNFEVGLAPEENVPVTGSLDPESGKLDLTVAATDTVAGPFTITGMFDPALFAAPGGSGGGPNPVLIGAGLLVAGASGAVLVVDVRRRREQAAG